MHDNERNCQDIFGTSWLSCVDSVHMSIMSSSYVSPRRLVSAGACSRQEITAIRDDRRLLSSYSCDSVQSLVLGFWVKNLPKSSNVNPNQMVNICADNWLPLQNCTSLDGEVETANGKCRHSRYLDILPPQKRSRPACAGWERATGLGATCGRSRHATCV